MHLLWITPNYNDHGGLERYNHAAVEALIGAGASVHAICSFECTRAAGGGFTSEVLAPASRALRRLYDRFWQQALDRRLRRYKGPADLVIAAHVHTLPAALRLARRRGVPCWVLTFGIEVWGRIRADYAEGLRAADRVITISEFTREHTRRSSGRTAPIGIVAPVTDPRVFRPLPIERPDGPARLLTVGRLAGGERYKGHDIVLDALPLLAREGLRDVEYWIAGDGEDRGRLEARVKAAGLDRQVRFLGRVEDGRLPEIYNACDIFVMPSYVAERKPGEWTGEGFGIVYIEASACGKPVIACDTGGQTDCVLHERTGLLIPPTAEAAAQALARLLRNPEQARELGRAGRRLVEERFTPGHFAAQWRDLLHTLNP